ncbi:3-hydroxybenzoate 4-monooxygenase [Flaviflexus salsibiostraticola]|uniref:3-hydroxybenzoate 4-monooxygenase n=1 Tax=Flaviflexus salsibiostraticola TaxID=1282737 RepID=A0A3Q8WUG8_9ACTO|nr:FAD-dependent monooxygenase [Flaviflexus salsibiostraticola]AZN30551.1 3-hydroxybenzoate 4-monooxygenase [Flaviflexus salsibiostraticola]
MKFHHHGYVSEDPRVTQPAGVGINRSPELPDEMDVLIIGAGPAGMLAAAQLSVFPDIRAHIVERRPSRLELGHADGIQARTVETFQAFGFKNEIVDEAYRITETAFWKPDPENPDHIVRTAITEDDPYGISEFEHIIVNQARVLDYFREFMARQPSRMGVNFGYEFVGLTIDDSEYPVEVELMATAGPDQGETRRVRAKYVLGADGARSKVRSAIGATHQGKISYHAWGVADVIAKTDFPDIRLKSIINSSKGNILHIPREGGYLFRTYVDLGEVPEDDNHEIRKTPLEEIVRRGNEIMAPYSFEVEDVAWWSVYEVGHRVTDRFDDVAEPSDEATPHVFIAGDACHTHSAKAGQGMNVSMQDGFNLSWKLAQVLRGYSSERLLRTYTQERQKIAQDLIDFDLEWSGRMAGRGDGESIEEFYVRTAEFPAGFMTQYEPSLLISDEAKQELATGYPLGKRFKSARAVRRADANDHHIGHQHRADGRWRIYVFADAAHPAEHSTVDNFAQWLENDPSSPVVRHTKPGDDRDSVFDVKVIYQQPHREFNVTDAPAAFRPECGPHRVEDWNLVYGTIPGEDIFDLRGISRDGAVIIVRPDMYVAHIAGLEDTDSIARFFEPIFDLSQSADAQPRTRELDHVG